MAGLTSYHNYDSLMISKLLEVNFMPQIRPVSDLRNKFAEISKIVHETAEPVS